MCPANSLRSEPGSPVNLVCSIAVLQNCIYVDGQTHNALTQSFVSSGTNLQALIDFTRDPLNFSAAEIVLVLSNKPDVQGLIRAEKAGIATKVSRFIVHG